jgi:nicotinamidase-related amidase
MPRKGYAGAMTAGLMIIDLIGDCLKHFEPDEAGRIVAATNVLLGGFRRAGLPLIWVRQEFAPDMSDAFRNMREQGIRAYAAGTPGAQLDPRLDTGPGDCVIVKKRYSAFFGTELDAVLEQLGIDELVLAGVNTHACIRTTAIDAFQRDLAVTLAADCLGSPDPEHAALSLRYMDGRIGRALGNAEILARIA